MPATAPDLLVSGDPIDRSITWVRREIVIEVQLTDWSGTGGLRHPVYLGVREDKAAREVVSSISLFDGLADHGKDGLPTSASQTLYSRGKRKREAAGAQLRFWVSLRGCSGAAVRNRV